MRSKSALGKSGLALAVLSQAVLHVDLGLPHRHWRLLSGPHQFGHLQPALEHVEDLALREDHEEGGEGLEQEGVFAFEDLEAEG